MTRSAVVFSMVFGGLLLLAIVLPDFRPTVFADDSSLDEAIAASIEQDRVLIVDVTASWCEPCERMDRTTWRDGDLTAWIETNAIAMQIDTDEQPGLARDLGIRGLPTIIVYVDGVERGRVMGYYDGDELLAWLQATTPG